jgi:hypothetical protein
LHSDLAHALRLPEFYRSKLLNLKRRAGGRTGDLPPDWLFSTKSPKKPADREGRGRDPLDDGGRVSTDDGRWMTTAERTCLRPAIVNETFLPGAGLCTKNPPCDPAKTLKENLRKSC